MNDRARQFRVGLTGGIASGKSTVARMFAAHGVPIIDTDVIAREVVAPGEPALDEIARNFGSTVIAADGALDRAALRNLVFDDPAQRRQLESILHPRIRSATWAQADRAGGPYQIIVVPLLVESPMRDEVDRILVVDVPEEVQFERLKQRDGESAERARRMIAAQSSRSQRLRIADDILRNDDDLAATHAAVNGLHDRYLQLAAQ